MYCKSANRSHMPVTLTSFKVCDTSKYISIVYITNYTTAIKSKATFSTYWVFKGWYNDLEQLRQAIAECSKEKVKFLLSPLSAMTVWLQ